MTKTEDVNMTDIFEELAEAGIDRIVSQISSRGGLSCIGDLVMLLLWATHCVLPNTKYISNQVKITTSMSTFHPFYDDVAIYVNDKLKGSVVFDPTTNKVVHFNHDDGIASFIFDYAFLH